jgi:hypothetical protein
MSHASVGDIVMVHHTELLRDEAGRVVRAEPGPPAPAIITAVDEDGLVSVAVFPTPTYTGLTMHDSAVAAHADLESPTHAPGIFACRPAAPEGGEEEQAEEKPAKKSAAKKDDGDKPPAS